MTMQSIIVTNTGAAAATAQVSSVGIPSACRAI